MSLSSLLVLSVLIALLFVLNRLRGIESGILALTVNIGNRDSDSIHDAGHPVFSVLQLCRARNRFAVENKALRRLEARLYDEKEWQARVAREAQLSSEGCADLRSICEAIIECECMWKEYLWMVEANHLVTSGHQSRAMALEAFHKRVTELHFQFTLARLLAR